MHELPSLSRLKTAIAYRVQSENVLQTGHTDVDSDHQPDQSMGNGSGVPSDIGDYDRVPAEGDDEGDGGHEGDNDEESDEDEERTDTEADISDEEDDDDDERDDENDLAMVLNDNGEPVALDTDEVETGYKGSLDKALKIAKPFCIIFYADKNKLSSFGTQKGYPVVVRCAVLPTPIRNGQGIGGGLVVGWLPIVRGLYQSLSKFVISLW